MKIINGILALFMTFHFIPNVYANPAVGAGAGMTPSMNSAALTGQVGVAAAVKGSVELIRAGAAGRVISSGEVVYEQDVIRTGSEATLQIILRDQTVFTIGKNSAVALKKFKYTPATDEGEIVAEVIDGALRMITGKIAKKKPENMKVHLPVGVLAVRGTIALVQSSQKTKVSTAVLLGPGKNTNTQHKIGAIILENEVQENGNTVKKSTLVSRAGFASEVSPGNIPTLFKMPDAQLKSLTNIVGGGEQQKKQDDDSGDGEGGGDGDSGDGDSAASQAGQDVAGGAGTAGDFSSAASTASSLGSDAIKAAQDSSKAAATVTDNRTKVSDLASIASGMIHFDRTSVAFGGDGSYNIHFDLDFSSKQFTAGSITGTAPTSVDPEGDNFSFNMPNVPFANLAGPNVDLAFADLPDVALAGCTMCEADVTIKFNNSGSIIANDADYTFKLEAIATSATDSGNAPRQ